MSVAVAHQATSVARTLALQEGAREARSRSTELVVVHVVESLDLDIEAAYRSGLGDEITAALAESDAQSVSWSLRLATTKDDVATEILRLADEAKAEVLVIGARRRSPVGKFLLGSVTQTLILHAEVPVVVVKAPA